MPPPPPTSGDPHDRAAMSLSRITSSRSQRSTGELSQAKTRDPLTGHLGHLSEAQEHALEKFKAICQEQKLYTPEHDGKRASHDDSTMLRFLRARRFDPIGALGQFKDTEEWRKSIQIDTLYEHFDIKSYEHARKVYPQWTGRRDRQGIPLYVYVIKHLNSKNMAAYHQESSSKATSTTHKSSDISPKLLRLFALYENMLQFVLPLCSFLDRPNPESHIVSTTNIVDISGVGLKQFWNLKGHMQEASTLATAHYPETLDRIFIIGAPAFFPTVWGWIKKWFDPVTTSKIFILSSSEVKSTLSSYIDPENFPKRYGGNMDWDFGTLPHLDQAAIDVMGEGYKAESGWIQGPIKWEHDTCVAVGSVNGEDRRKVVAERPTDPLDGIAEPEEETKPEEAKSGTLETTAELKTEDVADDGAKKEHEPEKESSTVGALAQQEESVQEEQTTLKEEAVPGGAVPMDDKVLKDAAVQKAEAVQMGEEAKQLLEDATAQDGPKKNEEVNSDGAVHEEQGSNKVGGAEGGLSQILPNGLVKNALLVVNGSIHKDGVYGMNGSA